MLQRWLVFAEFAARQNDDGVRTRPYNKYAAFNIGMIAKSLPKDRPRTWENEGKSTGNKLCRQWKYLNDLNINYSTNCDIYPGHKIT